MSTTHVLDEPFFQFDPFEGLSSPTPPMNPASSDVNPLTLEDDQSIQVESEAGRNPRDKGKSVSRPMPIMISPADAPEFDSFSMSPSWSASSSYPDTPDIHTALPSPAGSSSFPSFTLGSFNSITGWQSSSSDLNPDALIIGTSQDRKGKGRERDDGVPSIPSLTFASSAFDCMGLPESARPVVNEPPIESLSVGADQSDSSSSTAAATRNSPSRRHSFSYTRSRRPSSFTRIKARFILPSRAHARKVLSKKLPPPPVQLAIPQLTQTASIHTHSPTPLSLEVKLPLDEGVLETTDLCISLFKTKGRSNSSPLPICALDYIPVLSEDAFVPITFSRNLFDEVLPRELKLQIILSLVALHKSDQLKLISQAEWSVTRAISSKNRWMGKDKAIRELIKLSRVSKAWRNLMYDGQLWSTLDFHSFPMISKTLLSHIAKRGGRFITSIDLSGHVHVNPSTLLDITDNMCLAVPTSIPFTQLTRLDLRRCTALSTRSLHYLLVRSPGLRQVCFRGLPSVTNTTCDIIAMYNPRIAKLDLNRCPNMDGEGLKRLASAVKARGDLLQLTELRVSGLKNIDDNTMAILGQVAPFLEVLDLSYIRQLHNSALDAFVAVADDGKIASESVLLTAREAGRDPSDSTRYRRRVTRLRHLSLSSCSLLTDIACSHLAYAVPRLEFLELGGIGEDLSDEGLIRLLNTTPMIRRLDLEDAVDITDAVLSALTPAPSDTSKGAKTVQLQPGHALEHLVISYAIGITDNALFALIERCTQLRVLEADNTRMGPSVLRKFCELQRINSKIVAVDCRSITESVVKELAPKVRPRRGWRGWDARKLRFLDGRDFGDVGNGEKDKEKEAIMKVGQGQDELDDKRVVLKSFYSWQIVDAVWSARDKRRKAVSRRKANESSGSTETDSEYANGAEESRTGGIRWWSPGGRRSRSASGNNSPAVIPDFNGGDGCVIM
ncbi:RNI-like protein [Gymnopus androsaceus JB14]|uniref:RNI-like protein n=1 Tax=Gymnopus androsaceus JB14 TaxID=1447944 RepID=A0A6A4IEY2_9AGAR|nr:RNI-like protein [Gymnopus androsaceus JB14]